MFFEVTVRVLYRCYMIVPVYITAPVWPSWPPKIHVPSLFKSIWMLEPYGVEYATSTELSKRRRTRISNCLQSVANLWIALFHLRWPFYPGRRKHITTQLWMCCCKRFAGWRETTSWTYRPSYRTLNKRYLTLSEPLLQMWPPGLNAQNVEETRALEWVWTNELPNFEIPGKWFREKKNIRRCIWYFIFKRYMPINLCMIHGVSIYDL